MNKQASVKNIEKQRKVIQKQKRVLSKEEVKLQCACIHKKESGLTCMGQDKDGHIVLVCYACGQEVDVKPLKEEDLENWVKTGIKIIDAIKLSARPNAEKDIKMATKAAKAEWAIRNSIYNAYKLIINRKNENNDPENYNRNKSSQFSVQESYRYK